MAAELDGSGSLTKQFIYADGVNSPDYMIYQGKKYLFSKDHRGSIIMVVDSGTGEMKQKIKYSDWGEVLEDTSPGLIPFGYAGGDTNLYGDAGQDPITFIDPEGTFNKRADGGSGGGNRSENAGGGWGSGSGGGMSRPPETGSQGGAKQDAIRVLLAVGAASLIAGRCSLDLGSGLQDLLNNSGPPKPDNMSME